MDNFDVETINQLQRATILYQWEKPSLNIFGRVGYSIQSSTSCVLTEPRKSLRVFNLEQVRNDATE